MPPERFEGKSDARGDVYSLGLTLYELLTLRPAFDQTDHSKLMHQVTHDEPPAPRRCDANIPRDLETICLKSMRRDPAQRYQTAGEMADDLRRFVADRPIQARRIGHAELFWRWCRRNPAIASLTVLAVSLLVIVAAVSSIAYANTSAALEREAALRVKAEESRLQANQQRNLADANMTLALRAFEEIFAQATRRSAIPLAGSDSEDGDGERAGLSLVSPDTAAILNNLLKFYDEFGERNQSDPRLQREIARAYRRVGDIQQRLGQYEKAETAYRRVLDMYEQQPDPATTARGKKYGKGRDKAAVLNELGLVHLMTGRHADAEKSHRQALEVLAGLPQNPQTRFDTARTHNHLGQVLLKMGRSDDSEESHRAALRLLDELLAKDGTNADYRFAQAFGYRRLVKILLLKGKRDDAVAARSKAVGILEQLVETHADVPDYRYELSEELMRATSTALSSNGRMTRSPETEKQVHRATDLARDLVAAYPSVPQYQALRARTLRRLGIYLQSTGRVKEAESNDRKALNLDRALVQQFPSVPVYQMYLGDACQSLATIQLQRGQLKEARALVEEAIEAQQTCLKAHPDTRYSQLALVRHYQTLSDILRRQGEKKEAEEAKAQAEKIRKEVESKKTAS
jgi:tetratricopeptide (TPR) repeat protein